MNVTNTSLVGLFVGGQEEAQFPNIQGCALSTNMMTEKNGDIVYQRSLNGKKFYTQVDNRYADCYASFYPSVGLTADYNAISSYWVFGGSLYRLRPNGTSERIINNFTGNAKYGWSFCESGGERPFLLFCTGMELYAVDLKLGDVRTIAMPLNVRGETIIPTSVACLAGSIIVSDRGTGYAYYSRPYPLSNDTIIMIRKDASGNIVYDSDGITPLYNNVSVWSGNIFYNTDGALQYKNAESSSDEITRLQVIGDVLTVFGTSSIEFWIRNDAEGMTWFRTNYTSNGSLGLCSARSIGVFSNKIGFLGSGNRNGYGVYVISGTQTEKISPTWLDELLFSSPNVNYSYGYGYSYANHSFYCIHFTDKDGKRRCFAYDLMSGDWHERMSLKLQNNKPEATHYVCPIFTKEGKLIYGSSNTMRYATLYTAERDYWYEDIDSETKMPFVRSRQTPLIIDSEKEFILNALSIEGNFGNCYDRNIQPQALLEISNDGGYTFTNLIVKDLAKTGDYKQRLVWNGLGRKRNCVIKFSVNTPMDVLLQNASVTTVSLGYRL